MKKRLLITSVAMLIVVMLALSTATYAWFTSNAQVTAATITLNAESGAGTALGIGWLGGTTGTHIEANEAETYKPMIPSELDINTTDFADVTWCGATIYKDGDIFRFNTPYNPAPVPYQYNSDIDEDTSDIFYIENLSHTNTINTITMTLMGVDDANALLRVAVFVSDTSDGTYTLKAVLGKQANLDTEWGIITEAGEAVDDLCDEEVTTSTSLVLTNLAADGKIYFKVIAWLDGVVLDDSTASSTSTLGLNFFAE